VPTHVELVTPARKLFDGEAEFAVMRTEGGDIMFLPNHADFVGAVDICVLRIAPVGSDAGESDVGAPGEVQAAVAGGFVHVADNNITIVAAVAELADDIDVGRARAALTSAEEAAGAGSPEPVPAPEGDHGDASEPAHGSTMLALLQPDAPEVRARRARARLEAAGALDSIGLGTSAAAH
jgi:F-type H+-transporting ATPase subunit epsilon